MDGSRIDRQRLTRSLEAVPLPDGSTGGGDCGALSLASLSAGLDSLPTTGKRRRVKHGHGFDGAQYRSKAHMSYLNSKHESRLGQQELGRERGANESLRRAWSDERLRCGDKVACDSTGYDAKQHPDTYNPEQVISTGLRCVGGTAVDREGFDADGHRLLAIGSTLAGSMKLSQDMWVDDQVSYIRFPR